MVRFLIACEAEGIELLNCAPYIREWMSVSGAEESEDRRQRYTGPES